MLSHVFRGNVVGTEYSRPTVYVGLVSTAATEANLEEGLLANEVVTYDGNRRDVTFAAPVQEDGKATIRSEDRIEFTEMPSVTVRFVILCDTNTKGDANILWWLRLAEDKIVNAGDICRLEADELVVTLD